MKSRRPTPEEIAAAALEGRSVESSDPAVAATLAQMRQILASAQPMPDVPSDWILRAKAIQPGLRRSALRLLGSSRALAGARGAGEPFQRAFGIEEEIVVRLQYRPTGGGWSVVGQVAPGSVVRREGLSIELQEAGRFSFQAESLEQTGLEIDLEQGTFLVPSGSEELEADDPR